jgi:energy-coupling factor transporter ATP-binding protein EcfA2
MDDVLLGIVLERLDDSPLPEQATGLLLAALDSDKVLSAQLSAAAGRSQLPALPAQRAASPVGAYLRSLTVSGFRGIGPPSILEVPPGPGLTLVLGRNGSGKSSFAEALEVLLTGTVLRWDLHKAAVWRDSWRCKHVLGSTEISADFLVEGTGATVAVRGWPAGAGFDESVAWVQRTGQKRGGIDDLGWADALAEHRPFLSHTELEAFFGRPSELHDLLESVLGLEDLTTAVSRLNAARKQREDAMTEVKSALQLLRDRLDQVDDERAEACRIALGGKTWDLAAVLAAAVAGEVPDGGQLERLRGLSRLPAPTAGGVDSAAAGLREAADGLDAVAGTAAGQAKALAALLAAALEHHSSHGDGDCPVCGRSAALTPQWQQETREQLAHLRRQSGAADKAAQSAAEAADQAQALLQPPPKILTEPPPEGIDPEPAREAWLRWGQLQASADPASPAGLRDLADHLDQAIGPLLTAVKDLSAKAAAEHSKRDDRWAPVAAELAAWCADASAASEGIKPVTAIKKARTWLVSATGEIRNARLAPLADQARAVWSKLRQESNVDLGAFRLAGTLNQRKLELDVSIDGSPGAALGVMSQGEINALALSVFLPRATMPESPFRFLVIDDPVQAMDPAKVDGLARVLEQTAAGRQVIVFTHDNRLADAVKDLSIPVTILEVTRRPKSIVDVRRCLDPAEQALKDARDLNSDPKVPAAVAARVIPGLCRTAVEASLTQAVWRQQARAGRDRADIEVDLLAAKRRLASLAALAIFGDANQHAKVIPRLGTWGQGLGGTFRTLNAGAHQEHGGRLDQLISDTRHLVAKIRASLP